MRGQARIGMRGAGRIAAAAVVAGALWPAAAEAAIVDIEVSGTVDTLLDLSGTGFDNSFGVNDPITGAISYDDQAALCPDFCAVTAISVSLGGAPLFAQDPAVDAYTVDTTSGFAASGATNLGNIFGLTGVTIAFGANADGAGTFLLDSNEAIGFAKGTFATELPTTGDDLTPIPLPASLLLLLGGLGALAAAGRRRG